MIIRKSVISFKYTSRVQWKWRILFETHRYDATSIACHLFVFLFACLLFSVLYISFWSFKDRKSNFPLHLSPLPLFTLSTLSSFSKFIALLIIVQRRANSYNPSFDLFARVQSKGLSLNFLLGRPSCFVPSCYVYVVWFSYLLTLEHINTYTKFI